MIPALLPWKEVFQAASQAGMLRNAAGFTAAEPKQAGSTHVTPLSACESKLLASHPQCLPGTCNCKRFNPKAFWNRLGLAASGCCFCWSITDICEDQTFSFPMEKGSTMGFCAWFEKCCLKPPLGAGLCCRLQASLCLGKQLLLHIWKSIYSFVPPAMQMQEHLCQRSSPCTEPVTENVLVLLKMLRSLPVLLAKGIRSMEHGITARTFSVAAGVRLLLVPVLMVVRCGMPARSSKSSAVQSGFQHPALSAGSGCGL